MGYKVCDGDGQSDLGPLGSELSLECLSPKAAGLLTWPCTWGCSWGGAWAQVSFGVAERFTVEPPGQEGLEVDPTWTVALPLPGS